MLQTHAITDNIMTRSLPASFESASEWPECAEIIMRIHNQGGIPSPGHIKKHQPKPWF